MTGSRRPLLVDIAATLERHGLPPDDYRLADEIDPEAVERVLGSDGPETEVRCSVRDVSLVITADGPRVSAA
ncbi:hypothetical protein [Halostagnicola kamekurae]|uniref:Halobacterial output domain-containing protein n=1 Tax=Halostagnicola kamekurae TaxID=619731 RepID=A0A1I6RK76_9EURY|nr:hypothetical protein [Halostagnicola kamekurae]SFS65010.1 hypothetical protein SAMN04488556_1847 [Halostagnicola kamekurae]